MRRYIVLYKTSGGSVGRATRVANGQKDRWMVDDLSNVRHCAGGEVGAVLGRRGRGRGGGHRGCSS